MGTTVILLTEGEPRLAGTEQVKHTPGPWKWWTSNSWRRLKRDDRGITMNVLEPYVCRDGCPDLTITEADMNLIAAAPDLYEALRLAMPLLESANAKCTGDTAFISVARNAIAKAEGHTP